MDDSNLYAMNGFFRSQTYYFSILLCISTSLFAQKDKKLEKKQWKLGYYIDYDHHDKALKLLEAFHPGLDYNDCITEAYYHEEYVAGQIKRTLIDSYGVTLLSSAAKKGWYDIVSILLKYGADPNYPSCWGVTGDLTPRYFSTRRISELDEYIKTARSRLNNRPTGFYDDGLDPKDKQQEKRQARIRENISFLTQELTIAERIDSLLLEAGDTGPTYLEFETQKASELHQKREEIKKLLNQALYQECDDVVEILGTVFPMNCLSIGGFVTSTETVKMELTGLTLVFGFQGGKAVLLRYQLK